MLEKQEKEGIGKIFQSFGAEHKLEDPKKDELLQEVKPEDLAKKELKQEAAQQTQQARKFDNVILGKSAQQLGEIKIPENKPAQKVIERVSTGVESFDELIEGGFEKGSVVLFVGAPGTGKTIFALQFLYYGVTVSKEPGIYITFEEDKESLYRHALVFGWDFMALEQKNLLRVLEYRPHQVEKLMKEGGGPIKDAINEIGAKRLVVDSITSYALLFHDEYVKRQSILEFFDLLHKWGTTTIVISETTAGKHLTKADSLGFLSDAIIALYYRKEGGKGPRVHCCEILKMRGTKHTNKILALGFEANGIKVYPDVEIF